MATFKFQKIEHMLKDFKLFPDESLAAITDEDLDTYSDEYDVYNSITQDDIRERQVVATRVIDDVKELFGEWSNAHKYFERNISRGDDLVYAHSKKYTSPGMVRKKVLDAREKYTLVSTPTVGLDEFTMNNIDGCISYLLSRGFEFGRDFNAHNAIDIARCEGKDDIFKQIYSDAQRRSVRQDETMPRDYTFGFDSNDKCLKFCEDNSDLSNIKNGKILVDDTWYEVSVDIRNSKPSLVLQKKCN